MNHKMGFNPLSRTTAHRRAMLRNMVTSLFRYERITTTKAKAKPSNILFVLVISITTPPITKKCLG